MAASAPLRQGLQCRLWQPQNTVATITSAPDRRGRGLLAYHEEHEGTNDSSLDCSSKIHAESCTIHETVEGNH